MLRLITYVVLLSFTAATYAGECIGKVEKIYAHKDGGLAIASTELFGNMDGRHVCNLNVLYKGVEPGVCKAWFSQVLAAHSAKTNIRLVYIDANCSDQNTWALADTPHTLSSWF